MAIAGPTCDSADVLYEQTPYHLPLALAEGDFVDLLSAGAYTSTYERRLQRLPPAAGRLPLTAPLRASAGATPDMMPG